MGADQIRNVLKSFGLSNNEIEVYIFLSKHGIQKGLQIARQIKKDKAQIYRTLKSLQKKGFVEITLEFPKRYVAVPFESAIDSFIKTKRQEATFLEKSKTMHGNLS